MSPDAIALAQEVERLESERRERDDIPGDYYRDTERRRMNDAEFASTVDMLKVHAIRFGFTPGELKQIAFRAALELELYGIGKR